MTKRGKTKPGTTSQEPLEPPGKRFSKETKELDEKKIARIETTAKYASGQIEWFDYGACLGWWHFFPLYRGKRPARRVPILLAGVIQVGTDRRFVGVASGKRWIWFGDGGRLWLASSRKSNGLLLPVSATSSHLLKADEKRVWGENIIAMVEDILVPRVEHNAVVLTNRKYRRVIEGLVARRVEESRQLRSPRSATTFAKGVNEHWRPYNLTAPRHPTIRHAVGVSLVLDLDVEVGAELIELGALAEFRVPLVNRETARSILLQARRLLAISCPAWYAHGWLTDWRHNGSIDRMFRTEYVRLLARASSLEVDLDNAQRALIETTKNEHQWTNHADD